MRLLLDTNVLLWFLLGSKRLSRVAAQRIASADEVYVSAATIWEAAIKSGLGKLPIPPETLAKELDPNGFIQLPVLAQHAVLVATLPRHHNDPFDRLLVAQAISEPLYLLTGDPVLQAYSPQVVLI